MSNPTFLSETKAGNQVPAGDLLVIPVSRATRIHFPGWKGGLIWNRPVGLWVQSPDGSEQFVPVYDITRRIQWMLLGVGLLGSILIMIASRRKIMRRR
jgi:hypothetical protein